MLSITWWIRPWTLDNEEEMITPIDNERKSPLTLQRFHVQNQVSGLMGVLAGAGEFTA